MAALTGGKVFIIGIDGSKQADQAFEWYCQKLHQKDHQVLLLHVADLRNAEGKDSTKSESRKARIERATQEGEQLLEPYKERMKQKNISGSVQTRVSNKPDELIVEVVKQEKAVGVVMGTRGMGRVRRTIMGSVSDYVLHHAPCMVAICRQKSMQQ